MGTNYYIVRGDKTKAHIGKQSAGWRFLWRYPETIPFSDAMNPPATWLHNINDPENSIVDEYGHTIPKKDFWDIVNRAKFAGKCHYSWVMGKHGHVPATYVLRNGDTFIDGEFS